MKTIEEAAKDFSENIRENSLSGNNAGKEQYKIGRKIGFKAGVAFSQRWIPVEEELPETNEFCESKKCLVKNATYNCVDIARYYSNTNMWYFDSTDFIVTHWRPIDIT